MGKLKFLLIILCLVVLALLATSFYFWSENTRLTKEKAKVEEKLKDAKKEIVSLERQLRDVREEKDRAEKKLQTIRDSIADLEKERDALREKYEMVKKERDDLQKKLAKAPQQAIEVSKPTYTPPPSGAGEDYWADFVKKKAELEAKLEDLRKQLSDTQLKISELERKNKELSIKIDELTKTKQSLERQLAFRERMLKIMSKDLVNEREARAKAEKELAVLRDDNIRLKKEYVIVSKEKTKLAEDLKNVRDKKEILERRLSEIENVLKEKSWEMSQLQEDIYSAVKGAKKAVKSESAAVELPPIVIKPEKGGKKVSVSGLTGEIIAVNRRENFVIIDKGEISGVKPGFRFNVLRKGQKIGWIEVHATRKNISACIIKEVKKGAVIREGDQVVLQ